MKFTRDKRFWDEQEWQNRKPEWHWHAYRRHMVRRREQACDLASGARWRRVKKPLLAGLFRSTVASMWLIIARSRSHPDRRSTGGAAMNGLPIPQLGAMWLLDANNLLHRYHHAAPVQLQAGRQVHAVRGLAALATRLRQKHRPTGIAAVFDAGHSGRADILPTYKVGRSPTPPELTEQIDMARTYLPRFGCDTIRVEGFEADDVIATLTASIRQAGSTVYLVTGDKDLHALISDDTPRCAVFNRPPGTDWRLYEAAAVVERFGIAPHQLLDLLALTGDDSDGIPGVPGIGLKTAADLVRAYGSLEQLLGLISTIRRETLRLKLREHVETARLARRLLEPVVVPPDLIQAGLRPAVHEGLP